MTKQITDYIYYLHLSKDPDTQYYIGRAEDPARRWKEHKRAIANPYEQLYHDLAQLEKDHEDEIVMSILKEVTDTIHSEEFNAIQLAKHNKQPLLNTAEGDVQYQTSAFMSETEERITKKKSEQLKKVERARKRHEKKTTGQNRDMTPHLYATLIEVADWTVEGNKTYSTTLWGKEFTKIVNDDGVKILADDMEFVGDDEEQACEHAGEWVFQHLSSAA